MEKLILARNSPVEVYVSTTHRDMANALTDSFCQLLQAVKDYYASNPLTPIPAAIEVKTETDNADVLLWIICREAAG